MVVWIAQKAILQPTAVDSPAGPGAPAGHAGNPETASELDSSPEATVRESVRSAPDQLLGDQGQSVRSVVRSLYASGAEDLLHDLAAEGMNLDRTLGPNEIPLPWEEVEEEIKAKYFGLSEGQEAHLYDTGMLVDGMLSVEWLSEKFPELGSLAEDPAHLAEIENIAVAYSSESAELVLQTQMLFDRAFMQAHRAGWYTARPFLNAPAGRPGNGIFSSGGALMGWNISLRLTDQDFPELAESMDQLASARHSRDHKIRRYISDAQEGR